MLQFCVYQKSKTVMPIIFVKINQTLQLKVGIPGYCKEFMTEAESSEPSIEVAFTFFADDEGSTCGFIIDKSSIVDGELSIQHLNDNVFSISLNNVIAKLKIAGFALEAIERKDPVIITAIMAGGSSVGFVPSPHPEDAHQEILHFSDEDCPVAAVEFATKKSDL